MNPGTTFDSTKQSLQDLLKEIESGKIQLPDFQRGWIWDDNHVKSLLASVSVAYPIGAVMLYETGNPDVRFMPRVVEGVKLNNGAKPEWLILDGQQRLNCHRFQCKRIVRGSQFKKTRQNAKVGNDYQSE